jgi:hypothetical protein
MIGVIWSSSLSTLKLIYYCQLLLCPEFYNS